MTEKEDILEQYSNAFLEYINEDYNNKDKQLDIRKKYKEKKYTPFHKIDGNIFAQIIRNKLRNKLKDEGYKVSVNNSYIKGCFTEWDLLIYKGDESEYNIYEPENVLWAIELKCGGLAGYNNENDIKEFFDRVYIALKKYPNIKYLYLSLNETGPKTRKIENVLLNKYNNRFYSYIITTGSWRYDGWPKDNKKPGTIYKEDQTLKDIIKGE